MVTIAGRVTGARSATQKIVLFARAGTWWVQPFSSSPYTAIQRDSTWSSSTHLGTEYAALLVESEFSAPRTTDALPEKGGSVLAVATVDGRMTKASENLVPRKLQFSGYDWDVVQTVTDSAGVMHINSASNAWTDSKGWLHLRIARQGGQWTCAEVALSRSLGYGSYSFLMRQNPRFEPGTVLGMFTWDPLEAGQNHREIDIEISQWGDPAAKNAQFTIQPYYVPANVFRFVSPPGAITHSFRWEPGRVSFHTERERAEKARLVEGHVFTSGIPSPGGERVHINLYIFGKSRTPQQNGTEVVFEKFAYLP
ncbi:MAG: glycoside hydrolase family 16 protein [Bryobacteraceae bacterium]